MALSFKIWYLDAAKFPITIATIAENVEILEKPLSSDRSDNDLWDRKSSFSAIVTIAELFSSDRSDHTKCMETRL